MTKQQTAVEFAEELINVILYYLDDDELERIKEVFDEAKEMEKQQIIEARVTAPLINTPFESDYKKEAEQYYKETFNN
jgi:hypothetical protein